MFVKPSSRVRREALGRRQLLREREEGAVREVVPVDEEQLGVARGASSSSSSSPSTFSASQRVYARTAWTR